MIEQKIRDMLKDILDIKAVDVTREAHLRRDLGATSIDIVEFVAGIENEFGIEISDAEMGELVTVNDAIEFVGRKRGCPAER